MSEFNTTPDPLSAIPLSEALAFGPESHDQAIGKESVSFLPISYKKPDLPIVSYYLNKMLTTNVDQVIEDTIFKAEFCRGVKSQFETELQSQTRRFSAYPIHYPDLDKRYKEQQDSLWTLDEIDFSQDLLQWSGAIDSSMLNNKTRYTILCVLVFFHVSDSVVNENIASNFVQEIPIPEAKNFYGVQTYIETVHNSVYGTSLQLFCPVSHEEILMNGLDHVPFVRLKGNWMFKYMNREIPLSCRIFSFVLVEGLFFSSSFCILFWLKKKNLMNGLTFSN